MLEKKYQIHEFNPTIYPFRLWVGINPSLGDMQNKFYALTDKMERTDFTSEVLGNNTFTIATCYPVSDKKAVGLVYFAEYSEKTDYPLGLPPTKQAISQTLYPIHLNCAGLISVMERQGRILFNGLLIAFGK